MEFVCEGLSFFNGTACESCSDASLAPIGDFSPTYETSGCLINQSAVIGLYGMALFISIVSLGFYVPVIITISKERWKGKKPKPSQAMFEFRIACEFIQTLAAIVVASMEVSSRDGKNSIGNNLVSSIAWAVYACMALYNSILAQEEKINNCIFILRSVNGKITASNFRIYKISLKFMFLCYTLCAFMALAIFIDPKNWLVFYYVFLATLLCTFFWGTIQVLIAFQTILKVINASDIQIDPQHSELRQQLKVRVERSAMRHRFGSCFIAILIAYVAIPALRNRLCYMLASWVIISAVGCIAHPLKYLQSKRDRSKAYVQNDKKKKPKTMDIKSKAMEIESRDDLVVGFAVAKEG